METNRIKRYKKISFCCLRDGKTIFFCFIANPSKLEGFRKFEADLFALFLIQIFNELLCGRSQAISVLHRQSNLPVIGYFQ